MTIPKHGQGPKFINKTVTVDGQVWQALQERGVNMSELVRLRLEEALQEVLRTEGEESRLLKPTKVARR